MTWVAWLVVIDLVGNGLLSVSRIGKPRDAMTPRDAIYALVELGLLIFGVVMIATR